MTREVTNKLLQAVEDGLLDKDTVIMACVKYMSEDDVADMCHANEFFGEDEEEEEDEDAEEVPYEVSVWFERDRQNITLTQGDTEIFSLWDDDVTEAIEDGFLPTPGKPRASDSDWLPCAIEYAKSKGLIS